MMDATCYNDDEHGYYTEVKSDEGPQLTNGFRPHAYICENGEWKRAGTCAPKASGSIAFNYTGSQQTWTVPEYVTSIKIQVWGAQGGGNGGGKGGYSTGILNVTPGNTIYIYVGGRGNGRNGGWNGGGNAGSSWPYAGGGGTDIRYGGTSYNDRKIVAGGGGGANGISNNGGFGGAGGGTTGGSSYGVCDTNNSTGGTQTKAGTNSNSNCSSAGFGYGANGSSCNDNGGGGGWYGGGTGCASGGGSGYIGGVSNGTTTSGIRNGDGMARICWGNNTDCD